MAVVLIESMDLAQVGQHLCHLYRDERELRAALGDCVRAGLAAGHMVVLVSGSDTATVDAHLREDGVDPTGVGERGQMSVITVGADADGPGALLDDVVLRLRQVLDRRAALGFDVARLAFEVDALAGVESPADMVAHERLRDELLATGSTIGLCLFDRRRHDDDSLRRVEAGHVGQVVPSSELYRDAILAIGALDGGGLRVSGQVDLSNRSELARALAQAAGSGDGDLVVDLSAMSYVDVGGLRLLVEAAHEAPHRRLVLLQPATSVRQLLRLGDWGPVPNLVVTDGDGTS